MAAAVPGAASPTLNLRASHARRHKAASAQGSCHGLCTTSRTYKAGHGSGNRSSPSRCCYDPQHPLFAAVVSNLSPSAKLAVEEFGGGAPACFDSREETSRQSETMWLDTESVG